MESLPKGQAFHLKRQVHEIVIIILLVGLPFLRTTLFDVSYQFLGLLLIAIIETETKGVSALKHFIRVLVAVLLGRLFYTTRTVFPLEPTERPLNHCCSLSQYYVDNKVFLIE